MTAGSYNRDIYHGGDIVRACAEYGGKEEDWLDLSTGINPIPYPLPAVSSTSWNRLPSSQLENNLLKVAKAYYQVPGHMDILAAPGTQILIQLLPEILKQRHVSVLSPTYAEHETCWQRVGAHVHRTTRLDDIPENTKALIVVSPNNPTGEIQNTEALIHWAKELKARDGILILDEAFVDPIGNSFLHQDCEGLPVIVLKSFGKFFGLAGLRLGFAIGPETIIQKLKELIGPWALNGPAMEIGAQALNDREWISKTRQRLANNEKRLRDLLQQNKFRIEGEARLFTYARHEKARSLFQHLCIQKILVRPFDHSPTHLRFGHPGREEDWQRLSEALHSFI
ncbi:threonine-phosphate decarboxylase CobD [Sneathiella limimaris]|uniref:threonine-phosphate decarboxylase CobD n=1 Tax=Sneathiella limimaris TaxID=1964213 RepID=UPI00146D876D|nr:threonine-phosphate decarboxylase CobD [Sneathiella limimaris]